MDSLEHMKDLDIDLLPGDIQRYCRIIGVDNLLKLAEAAGGKRIYIPKKEGILKYFAIEEIRREHQAGATVAALSQKYGISERTIYKYIKK